jgi:hypothetical protein
MGMIGAVFSLSPVSAVFLALLTSFDCNSVSNDLLAGDTFLGEAVFVGVKTSFLATSLAASMLLPIGSSSATPSIVLGGLGEGPYRSRFEVLEVDWRALAGLTGMIERRELAPARWEDPGTEGEVTFMENATDGWFCCCCSLRIPPWAIVKSISCSAPAAWSELLKTLKPVTSSFLANDKVGSRGGSSSSSTLEIVWSSLVRIPPIAIVSSMSTLSSPDELITGRVKTVPASSVVALVLKGLFPPTLVLNGDDPEAELKMLPMVWPAEGS